MSYVALICTIITNITHLLLLCSLMSLLLYFLAQLLPSSYLITTKSMSNVTPRCTIMSNITHLLLLSSHISSLLYFLGQLLSSSYPTTTNFMSSLALRCTIMSNITHLLLLLCHYSSLWYLYVHLLTSHHSTTTHVVSILYYYLSFHALSCTIMSNLCSLLLLLPYYNIIYYYRMPIYLRLRLQHITLFYHLVFNLNSGVALRFKVQRTPIITIFWSPKFWPRFSTKRRLYYSHTKLYRQHSNIPFSPCTFVAQLTCTSKHSITILLHTHFSHQNINSGSPTMWKNGVLLPTYPTFVVLKISPFSTIFIGGGIALSANFPSKIWSIFSLNCHNYFIQKLILLHLSAKDSYYYDFLVIQILALIFDQNISLLF
ncbi:hypothetical protein PFNF54_00152 [Plasmodium falciparum NF54]|uniref:Uncharacterized protein n=1 Tax=Plasmodium falciparum (isolate NF54) TaxID=5843 RepID=W7K170_PLAFO|nr:hypothetical protein PFNF54_00152 [Plasmodium falciparum NF54]